MGNRRERYRDEGGDGRRAGDGGKEQRRDSRGGREMDAEANIDSIGEIRPLGHLVNNIDDDELNEVLSFSLYVCRVSVEFWW